MCIITKIKETLEMIFTAKKKGNRMNTSYHIVRKSYYNVSWVIAVYSVHLHISNQLALNIILLLLYFSWSGI